MLTTLDVKQNNMSKLLCKIKCGWNWVMAKIMFNVDSLPNFQIKEIAFTPQIEEWNGEKQIKLRICDIR